MTAPTRPTIGMFIGMLTLASAASVTVAVTGQQTPAPAVSTPTKGPVSFRAEQIASDFGVG